MMAAFAAAGAAFTACSSDDTLATQQTPEAPVVKGTPFKVSAFAEGTTRATRYNSDAWDGTNDETWVSNIKVWGKQPTSENLWMNNVVFERETYDGEWSPVRNNDGNIASLSWPTTNTDEPTTFYAITDNAIGAATGNPVTGVNPWMSTAGEFEYTMPSTTSSIKWSESNSYAFDQIETGLVDNSKVNDLMVANISVKESGTTEGTLPLAFSHILSGLTIKAKFVNEDGRRYYDEENEEMVGYLAKIKGIKVCGLNTSGTYIIGSGWSSLNTTSYCYYKDLSSQNIQLDAEATLTNTVTLVSAGEWLVIPQTTTPWDLTTDKTFSSLKNAYIGIYIEDENESELVLYYPLSTTFNPGKNKVLTIEIGDGRDVFSDSEGDGYADYQFEPGQAGE